MRERLFIDKGGWVLLHREKKREKLFTKITKTAKVISKLPKKE